MKTDALIQVIDERYINHEKLQLRLTASTATIAVLVDGEGWRPLHQLERRAGRFPAQELPRALRSWLLETVERQERVSAPPERLDELLRKMPIARAKAPRSGREAA